jgi:hypothetical protein
MKKTLSVICILAAMLSSCNDQGKSKSPEKLSAVGSVLSLQTIDQQMEACSASVFAYDNLIDQVLGGDFEAMKKLEVTKELAVTKLENLKKLADHFNAKQSETFAAVKRKFTKVNGRIK